MKTLRNLRTTMQRRNRRSLLLGMFGALVLTHVSNAEPIFFKGSLGITVEAPPLEINPNLLYPDSTTGNEIGFILTNNSTVDAKILNVAAPTFAGKSNPITSAVLSGEDECVGTILGPGGSCGYYVVFSTASIAPDIFLPATLQDSVSVQFATMKTNGQPLPVIRPYAKTARLTVYDSSISSIGDPGDPSGVPDPQTYALTGCGLIAIGVANRRPRAGGCR